LLLKESVVVGLTAGAQTEGQRQFALERNQNSKSCDLLSAGHAVNSAINSNFEHVLKELQHPIEKALEDALLEISNNCVRGFTLDQLCPPE